MVEETKNLEEKLWLLKNEFKVLSSGQNMSRIGQEKIELIISVKLKIFAEKSSLPLFASKAFKNIE